MSAAFAWLLVRLRLLVVPAWIAAAVLATVSLPAFTDRPASATGGLVPTSSGSLAVEKQGIEAFGSPLLSRVAVVQRDPNGLSLDAQKRALRRAVRIDRGHDPALHSVAFALPISNAARVFPSSREQGTTVITYLYFRSATSVGAQLALAHSYENRIRGAGDPVTGVTGTIPAREAEFDQINRALPLVEAATIGLIAVLLLIVFRGIGAPLVTLGAAGISFLISIRVLTWVADRMGTEVPREVEPVLVALLLGLTTDYAVFFLSGARRRLVEGEGRVPAAQRSARLVLPITVTAGLIVAVGSGSLVIGNLGFFRAFGPGMAVTVLVTLAVTVTFVPAAIAIFGRALFWPGLRESKPREPSRARRHLGRIATARPVATVLVIVTAAVLVVAALEARSTALGLTLLRGLPSSSEVRSAASAAGQGFAPGIVAPTEILLRGPGLDRQRAQLERLQAEIEREPGVAGVVGIRDQPAQVHRPLFVNEAGDAARFAVIFGDDPLSTHAIHALRRLEDDLPSLLQRAGLGGARTGVAGDTALAKDSVETIHGDIARIALALLLANFVLLAIFLRALLAPLYLLAASVLALTAALGVTTWVFQSFLGHQDLTYYVPFAAAVLLLSLGSDYNIFIAGRIWQEAERRPLREAIRYATPRASGTIAIAGLTLAGSFALLALIPIQPMRELAFVMAAGILIDSFLVRSVLVPSLMAAFGRASWWPNSPPQAELAADQAPRPRDEPAVATD
ncbi:MAG TPA: MMPL family transporter [Gaiellaceae bacterium]|nr:MMPL family transporter [Gaiellaceae bacterium]